LHVAPKSLTIFFAINVGVNVGAAGGAVFSAPLPLIELFPGLYTWPLFVAIQPVPFPVTIEPVSCRNAVRMFAGPENRVGTAIELACAATDKNGMVMMARTRGIDIFVIGVVLFGPVP
jgi:hypothetical protein